MFDTKLEEVKQHFGIQNPGDWRHVSPVALRAMEGVGPQFVNYVRLHLANFGVTMQNDQTPLYWQQTLSVKRGVMQLSRSDNAVTSDFTILIDTAEQMPFTFQGMRADANQQHRPLVVQTRKTNLGVSRGDYSIEGMEGHVHIERKSCEDAISTVLGWGERREQFERTLRFMAEIPSSAVIVECDRDAMLEACQSRGKKSRAENQKILNRQVMAWEDDYRVPWVFNRDRRRAEIRAYLWLQRAWRHRQQTLKKTMKGIQ